MRPSKVNRFTKEDGKSHRTSRFPREKRQQLNTSKKGRSEGPVGAESLPKNHSGRSHSPSRPISEARLFGLESVLCSEAESASAPDLFKAHHQSESAFSALLARMGPVGANGAGGPVAQEALCFS